MTFDGLLCFLPVGLGAFIYHEKYMNKPQTLEDRYSSSDSDGSSVDDPYHRISQIDCVGFDTTRVTFVFLSFRSTVVKLEGPHLGQVWPDFGI